MLSKFDNMMVELVDFFVLHTVAPRKLKVPSHCSHQNWRLGGQCLQFFPLICSLKKTHKQRFGGDGQTKFYLRLE